MTDECEIRAAILRVLPAFPEEKMEPVLLKISTLEVFEACDLKYVRELDLEGIISPICCRKLVEAWNGRGRSCYFVA